MNKDSLLAQLTQKSKKFTKLKKKTLKNCLANQSKRKWKFPSQILNRQSPGFPRYQDYQEYDVTNKKHQFDLIYSIVRKGKFERDLSQWRLLQ